MLFSHRILKLQIFVDKMASPPTVAILKPLNLEKAARVQPLSDITKTKNPPIKVNFHFELPQVKLAFFVAGHDYFGCGGAQRQARLKLTFHQSKDV